MQTKLKQVIITYDISKNKLLNVRRKVLGNKRILEDQHGRIYVKNYKDSKYKELKKTTSINGRVLTIKDFYINDKAKYVAYNIIEKDIQETLGYKFRLIDKLRVLKI